MSYLSDLLGDAYKEGMTLDEASAALESAHAGESDELTRLKNALSRSNSEAADYKRKLRAKQSDDEAKQTEIAEQLKALTDENTALKREKAISERTASLISIGYDKDLAVTTATAMADGNMDAVMQGTTKFLEAQKKAIAAEAMRGTPKPAGGNAQNTVDYSKKIEEAQSSGDIASVAYYTRLQNEKKE